MNNALRAGLNKAGAFAIAVLIVIAFVFLSIRAVAPATIPWFLNIFGSHSQARLYPEPVYLLILARLPQTLQLLLASFVIASVAAFLTTTLAARAPRLQWVSLTIALPLRSIPFVWLAAVAALLVARSGYFESNNQPAHLLYPALCLAFFQIPFLLGARSFGDIIRAFARALPQILGATAVLEAFFAWPGVGRLFYQAITLGAASVAIASLLLAASAVLLVRVMVSDV